MCLKTLGADAWVEWSHNGCCLWVCTQPSDQEMRDKQARILAGAPFLILLQCQAKTEMHITQLFAVPQPQKMNERQRVYRVCKVDCGHNIAQADNLWNIDSATDVLEELQERLVCVAWARCRCHVLVVSNAQPRPHVSPPYCDLLAVPR